MKVKEILVSCRVWLWDKLRNWPRWGKITFVLALIAACGLGWSLARGQDDQVKVSTAIIERQDLERVVFTSGNLESKNEQVFFSPVESTLMELNAKLGDRVNKGQVLGRLDTMELGRIYQQALSNLAGKEADLAAALASDDEQNLKEAEAAYEQYKNHRDRLKTLFESGALSREELENAEADMQRSYTAYREALVKKEQNASIKQVKALESQVELCRQEASKARERLELATFTAAFDGVVTSLSVKEGNKVQEGEEILILAEDKDLQVDGRVNEVDAGELQPGQNASITCLALPGRNYEGEIIHIGGAAVQEESKSAGSAAVKIPFTIRLKGDCSLLKLGYSVNISIKTMEVKEIIAVPVEAVIEEKGRKKVWVLKEGRLEERFIETNRGNELKEIVVSGLLEGEEVVKNPSASLSSGQKAIVEPEESRP